MKRNIFILLLIVITGRLLSAQEKDFLMESTADFSQRLAWFKQAKYGMFIHFGLYSQLGGKWKGKVAEHYAEWIQANMDGYSGTRMCHADSHF